MKISKDWRRNLNDIKILVIEDELIIAKSLEMYLNTLKYSCSTASKDIQILEILKTFTPDLILMDILLVGSKFDGIDLAREIKKTLDIPIIFITAYSDTEIIQKAKEVSPYGYLLKPIQIKDLEIGITISLHKHKFDKIIREKESWFNKSLNSIGEGFIATDLNDNIKYMNCAAEKFTGFLERNVVGKNINSILNLKDIRKVTEHIFPDSQYVKLVINNLNKMNNIRQLISKDNKYYIVNVNKSEITDENDKLGYIYVINDLSESACLGAELTIREILLEELNKAVEKKY